MQARPPTTARPLRPRRPRPAVLRARRLAALVGLLGVVMAAASTCNGPGRPPAELPSSTRDTTAARGSDCIAGLDAAARAGQLLMVLTSDATSTIGLVADGAVGGVALASSQSPEVTRQLTGVAAAARVPAFIASDEEGGTVQRLRSLTGAFPSARAVAETMSPETAGTTYEAFARELVDAGITMVFGPSLDTGSGSDLGTRTFADDPDTVAAYGIAVVRGAHRAGLTAVVKHWPGIGRGDADTHDGPAALPAIDDLRGRDMRPFQVAIDAGAPAVMVTHARVPGLTGELPASLSTEAITGELRGRQHFDGLVVTDSLSMGAVAAVGPQDEAAERAISAGADVALVEGGPAATAAHRRLTEAIVDGRLDGGQVEKSVRRVLAVKGVDPATCRRST